MTNRGNPAKNAAHHPSSALSASSHQAVPSAPRQRNRHLCASGDAADGPSGTASTVGVGAGHYHASRSPVSNCETRSEAEEWESSRARHAANNAAGGTELVQFLEDSWTQSWSSIQSFTSNLIFGGGNHPKTPRSSTKNPGSRANSRPDTWGPAPPIRPSANRSAAAAAAAAAASASLAQREAGLKAAKTASLLESQERGNGGLAGTARYKRRSSDEIVPSDPQHEEQLVYIHDVQPDDTYAGIILRYRCREDVFRKSNGLWSRDTVQTRKWLIVPTDACEIRGRPCNAPSAQQDCTDLLAPTPAATEDPWSGRGDAPRSDFFGLNSAPPADAPGSGPQQQGGESDKPWTHVRWVQIDSLSRPIQIARMARQSLGYFPARRKKSIRTGSTRSTPRQSLDLSTAPPGSMEGSLPCRHSSFGSHALAPGSPTSSRSRVASEPAGRRPQWMRRPGGVGSMGKSSTSPGPDQDYFNNWTKKHLPGLSVEGLPSMSVMGSETARFGITQGSTNIVESPFEEGRDAGSASRQGSGLDRAAAAVEQWLRGALARRPGTPLLGGRMKPNSAAAASDEEVTDLIELTDAASEEERIAWDATASLAASTALHTASQHEDGANLRGQSPPKL
ncbi:uncharacterized protein UV8b_00959 [Ustilaginoidea virens]|uniref:LysM domain-containing protein n=1 Tax=Ustilaginoidea virens TaxID=1159556 RepID=A0A063C3K0_USTVR|nr:uncharacterized protein UV8b_00959 [Ustilaginoidea virens]QUC16718.1 hypothetical protein UV8b_00959 [Ustilaginoidea virens]GAO15725.1 hypothetical protein UVI_02043460 [Ustilaginoidea virens]